MLRDVRQFFVQYEVSFCEKQNKIIDQPRVEWTGGSAHMQHPGHVKEQDTAVFISLYTHACDAVRNGGIALSEKIRLPQ